MSWFLLKDRRHEGPFTRDDLLNQVLQGELKLEAYLIRSEDLERGVISYVRVSGVVGALLPPEHAGPKGEARRETRDPDGIDAFVPKETVEPMPIERIAALASQALDLEPADLVGRGARTLEKRTQEIQAGSSTRSIEVLSDEPSWVETLLTGRMLGRFAGALVFLWVVSLGIEQWKRPGAERQVAAVKGSKRSEGRSRSPRPARASKEGNLERPRLMPTERPTMAEPPAVSPPQMPPPSAAGYGAGNNMRGLATPVDERTTETVTDPTDADGPAVGEGGPEPLNGDEREPNSVEPESDDAQIDAEPVEPPEEGIVEDPEVEIVPEEN